MSLRQPLTARRLLAVAAAIALCVGLGACGNKESHPHYADNEGFYVDAGRITYQVQISRQLNPYSTEDKSYLLGVSAPAPTPSEEWFGIFLIAKNQTHKAAITSDSFDLIDTQGHVYYPIPINTRVNQLAWTPQVLRPGETEPAEDSIASFGPTQGQELLFKLSSSAYANRPLALQIRAKGQAKASRVSLDL